MKDTTANFKINHGVLTEYTGKAEHLILPDNITKIEKKVDRKSVV